MNFKVKRILTRIFDKSIKTDWKIKLMLCLSIVFALCFFAFNLITTLFSNKLTAYIGSQSLPSSFYFYREHLLFFISANRMMYILCSIAGCFLLYGIHLMWRGYKWGLLFYTIGKISQISIPIIFLGHRMWAIGDIMIALLFLVFYYRYSFTHEIEKENRKYNQIKPEADNE
ncbi:MAG: hypothetical protein HUK18_00345 [Bacteroidales bacterium]|nr:hypothetical protein [Bacteroidales bacterium]